MKKALYNIIMLNKYHRHLDLPNYTPNINFSQWDSDGYKWLEFHKTLDLHQLNNQLFVDFLKSLGMTSSWIEVFYTPPKEDGIIHSDNTEWEDWAKIIFQYGANGSTMRWWNSTNVFNLSTSIDQISENEVEEILEYKNKKYDRTTEHYHGRILYSHEKDATLLYEAEIGNASLANVGVLHSSHNPTNEKRFVVTVALFDFNGNRILFDDAVQRLSPHIKTSSLM
jgi:hypothetical protein